MILVLFARSSKVSSDNPPLRRAKGGSSLAARFNHVLDRGDRQEPIVQGDADRAAFVRTLGEAAERAGWRIHAFVLMSNHYHLLLETPEHTLVAGMRWFQTTWTVRFNSFHRLSSHLFQGGQRISWETVAPIAI